MTFVYSGFVMLLLDCVLVLLHCCIIVLLYNRILVVVYHGIIALLYSWRIIVLSCLRVVFLYYCINAFFVVLYRARRVCVVLLLYCILV